MARPPSPSGAEDARLGGDQDGVVRLGGERSSCPCVTVLACERPSQDRSSGRIWAAKGHIPLLGGGGCVLRYLSGPEVPKVGTVLNHPSLAAGPAPLLRGAARA